MTSGVRGKNRFGKDVVTEIPVDAPRAHQPGHKLRTSNEIIDRAELHKLEGQRLEYVREGDQVGIIRLEDGVEEKVPNQFSGPSFRNTAERFRFDGHKMLHHLDRVLAWQRGEQIAPVHIDMGLTKFCNTACLYCYAVVQNMTQGKMIEREALLRYIEDCGRLGVRSRVLLETVSRP